MLRNILVWTVAILLSAISGAAALGSIAKQKAPELALSLFPINGFAFERIASEPVKLMIAKNRGQFPKEINSNSIRLARQAFKVEPVTPQAITVIALSGEKASTDKLMRAALTLSRREQLVTGWMIVDSGAREDIPAILKYYDTMLRTSSSAGSVVIPVMANALANDDFITPFASLLEKKPPWASQFWATVVGIPSSLGNAARLREALYKSNDRNLEYRDDDLIMALVSNQRYDEAKSLYHVLVGEKGVGSLIGNSNFETESLYPPFDWQLFSTGDYGAIVNDGKLQLSAISNSGGLFARQLVRLPSGVLTLEIKSMEALPEDVNLVVNLTCAEQGANVLQPIRIPLKTSLTKQKLSNTLSQCQYYWLNIFGRSSESNEGFDISLDYVKLEI